MEVVAVVWVSLENERKLEEFLKESLKRSHDCHGIIWHWSEVLSKFLLKE